jgi:hypothetical protein
MRGKYILLTASIFLIILSSNLVVAELCYQETATVSTECGGLSTGSYSTGGDWANNSPFTYDGDWSTWGYPLNYGVSYLNINYTKPTGATNASYLKVKDVNASGLRSVTILQSCWTYNLTTLMFRAEVMRAANSSWGTNWSCYNGTDWAFLSNGDGDSLLYEEGMWWDIGTSQNETENETAEWTENLNNELFAYYNFSNENDSVGDYQLITDVGNPLFITNGSSFRGASGWTDGSSKWKILDNDQMDFTANDYQFTINVWMKTNGTYNQYLLSKNLIMELYIANSRTIGVISAGTLLYSMSFPDTWFMLTLTRNTTNTCIWMNGTSPHCVARNTPPANTEPFYVGSNYGSDYSVGYFDEMGIWNRSLSTEEINDLYNNGEGIFYTASSQNETPPTNETPTGFWNLSGTNLYPASLSYKVGIGTLSPGSALQVIGTILASSLNVTSKIFIGNGSLQLGTQDAYGRNQIWNFLPASVLRLGSLGPDGDPQTVSSEGIVVYGNNSKDDAMSSSNWGYARIKPNRIGLYTSINGTQDYYFRVDPTSLYLKNDSFTKTFEITRQTGLVSTKIGYSVNGQTGMTNNTGFWMCKDSTCSTTCQVDIKGGIIVGCV